MFRKPSKPRLTDQQRAVMEGVNLKVPLGKIASDLGVPLWVVDRELEKLKRAYGHDTLDGLVEAFRSESDDIELAEHFRQITSKPKHSSYFIFRRIEKWLRGGRTSKVTLPPGTRISGLLRFVYSKKTFAMIFAQVIADFREEYFDALRDGEDVRAKWVAVRGHIEILATIVTHLFSVIGKKVLDFWKGF